MKYSITANRLKEALNTRGMTARELSTRSGVSEASISQYINGTHKPGNISCGKIAEVLDCDPVWLMGFDSISPFSEHKRPDFYRHAREAHRESEMDNGELDAYISAFESKIPSQDPFESKIYHFGHYVTDRMIEDRLYFQLVETTMAIDKRDIKTAITMLEYLAYKREKG